MEQKFIQKNNFMKHKLYLLTSLLFCVGIVAQTTYYIPGSGTIVKKLNFENSSQLTEKFNYSSSWAGVGFGLSGTQRGAPENVSVVVNPQAVTPSGNQVLAFYSSARDADWYTNNPSAVATNVYGSADGESQDDFFMYGPSWVASETPSVMTHVFLPSSLDINGVTSLRMPVKYNSGTSSWPGIWCYGNRLLLRGPGRNDIQINTNAPNGGKDTWWTLGVSVTPNGDIQYYATANYVTELTKEHIVGVNSIISPENNLPYKPVDSNSDAIILSSNRNVTTTPTLIDNLIYTKGTTAQVLSVSKNELLTFSMYPNPTSKHLFINGIKETTSYKIYDDIGRIIKNDKITTDSNKIDVDLLPKGIYFLTLGGYTSKSFIKK